jgi:hypothetical protein
MAESDERARGGRVLLLDDPGFFRDFVTHAFSTAGFDLTLSDNEVSAWPAWSRETSIRWRWAGLGAWSRSLTLSEGGLFVRTDAPPAMGRAVWIHFGLADSARTLDIESIVVHVVKLGAGPTKPAGFGVRFAGLSEDDRAALAAFVKRESLSVA